jgi:hypothetical protein
MDYFAITETSDCTNLFERFLSPEAQKKPMLVEAFVKAENESFALETLRNLDPKQTARFKRAIKKIVGADKIRLAKNLLRH